MLHVALGILTQAAAQDLLPRRGRVKDDQIHRVLELVAEPEGAAALIHAASPHQAAGNDLIRRPQVNIMIKRGGG